MTNTNEPRIGPWDNPGLLTVCPKCRHPDNPPQYTHVYVHHITCDYICDRCGHGYKEPWVVM